jgi:hypothetical protein
MFGPDVHNVKGTTAVRHLAYAFLGIGAFGWLVSKVTPANAPWVNLLLVSYAETILTRLPLDSPDVPSEWSGA